LEQQIKINTNRIGQRAFLAIALIAFALAGYISYRTLAYGNGSWYLNRGSLRIWTPSVTLTFIFPILFLEACSIYRKAVRRNIKTSSAFLIGHIIASVLFLLFLSVVAFRPHLTNEQYAFSLYESGDSLTVSQRIGFLLVIIQTVFVILLLKRILAKK